MNKGKGGKQLCMGDWYYTNGKGKPAIQEVTVENIDKPKGLQIVSEEQGL